VTSARITSDPELVAEAAKLRHRVFVGEQGVDQALEADGHDGAATHVVLTQNGRVTGTARIFDAGDSAVVGRVAISAERRERGLGALVMSVAERWAGDNGLATVELHAQQAVVGFYARLGYAGVGEPYQEAGIPHLTMRKELIAGLRRVRDADGPALQALIGGVWAEYPGVVLDVDGEEPWLRAPAAAFAGGGELWVAAPDAGAIGAVGAVGAIVASVGWRPHARGAELKSLYVAAPCRGQGMGTRLVHFVERRVGGRARLRAWSDSRFTASHHMYERLGYRRTGASRELHDRSRTVELEFEGRDAC
jgi:predicted GNAT family N-acyltransferase/L-amino acid N-acyltransferase YncA